MGTFFKSLGNAALGAFNSVPALIETLNLIAKAGFAIAEGIGQMIVEQRATRKFMERSKEFDHAKEKAVHSQDTSEFNRLVGNPPRFDE
jgi:hypothetical protein